MFIQDKICLSRPSEAEVQTHDVAQKICRRQGGYLATATDPQIEFISQNYAVNPNQNRSEMNFWMNYVMIHNNRNSSTWNVAQEPVDEQQPEQLPSGLLPTSVPKNLSDSSVICLQLLFKYNRNKVDREWKPSNCNQRVPYMCEKRESLAERKEPLEFFPLCRSLGIWSFGEGAEDPGKRVENVPILFYILSRLKFL